MHRINRKGFAPLANKQKIGLVIAAWLVSAGFLLTLNRPPVLPPSTNLDNTLRFVSFDKNHMGRCRFGLSDPDDKRYLGTVSFESLKSSCADSGPFKTAALRELEIRQLKIDLTGLPASNTRTAADAAQSARSNCRYWTQVLMDRYLQLPEKQDFVQIALPDFSHLVQIRISDFECRFLEGQAVGLQIQSKKASVQPDHNGAILLRGHVIIRTPEAALESNTVLWDIQNKTFRAQGFYSIRTGDELEKGVDGLFGPQLNKLTQQKPFAHKGEM